MVVILMLCGTKLMEINMSTLATGYIQILPSMAGMKANLVNGMTPDANAAGGVLGKSIGKAAIIGVAAAGIGMAIKKSITEGAKLEQSLGGVETLYKKHADIVIKNANRAWKTAGISANDYMEQSTSFAASLLQSLGGNTKKAAKMTDMAIIDMSDNANKFGTDMQRIQDAYQGFAKQNYMMLDNLKLGYGGTKTEMERLLADAEKLSGKEYDISNLADVYEAIHVIQKELGVTGTTSKEAASTLSGSFASMQSALTNFWGALGTGGNVSQALSGLVESASTFLFDNLIPAIGNVVKAIPDVLFGGGSGLVGGIISKLPKLIKQIIDTAVSLLNGFATNISTAIMNFANDPNMQGTGLEIVKKIGLGLIKGIPTLLMAVANLATVVPRTLLNLLKQKLAPITETFTKPFTDAKNTVKGIIDKIKGFFPLKLGKIFKGLKLPSFGVGYKTKGVSGKVLKALGLPGMPHLTVNWNAAGGIFDKPTVLQGVGEAGAEAVVPLTVLWQKLENIASAMENGFVYMGNSLESGLETVGDMGIVLNDREFGRAVRRVK